MHSVTLLRTKSQIITTDMHPPTSHQLQMPTAPTPRLRPKRATAPLDAAARARLAALPRSDDSSGSEHQAAALSSLVNDYLLETDTTVPSATLAVEGSSDLDDEPNGHTSSTAAADILAEIKDNLDPTGSSADELRRRLVFAVADAMRGLDDLRPNQSAFPRAVMSRLRERGHDAGLCKVRWDKSSGVTAGSYEYIDVIAGGGETRYIVDVGFAAEFEVALSTEEYEAVRTALPEVLIARPEHLRQVVKLAASAARRSLKSSGLSVPPWRKRRFMMTKWLGPYKRTVNSIPASAGTALGGSGVVPVCRTIVGFAPQTTVGTSSGFWG
ncbi:uncharacterized protein [Aegilops tauschii subsp. strangulata]|uniref:DUF506 family protein n=2 Tax=Aegilops tauschii TaxID=37682 RepID=A0A453I9L7_AEGTS|nr:uncharacterized protein LOC109778188 [Aegilops tauschii subsp. strangulata]